jgi:hypothetical protein
LLHLDREGFMSRLEIFKDGGSEIINPPSAGNLMLLLPEDGGGKPGQA